MDGSSRVTVLMSCSNNAWQFGFPFIKCSGGIGDVGVYISDGDGGDVTGSVPGYYGDVFRRPSASSVLLLNLFTVTRKPTTQYCPAGEKEGCAMMANSRLWNMWAF